MKILLPIKLHKTGGTSSFARKFRDGMKKLGHSVVFSEEDDYDLLLVSPSCSFDILRKTKQAKKPIVHRLDGVYYPATVSGWMFPIYNARLQLIHHMFSDFTVYQSQFSKKSVNKFLWKNSKPSTVIYNGVDTDTFSPSGKQKQLRDNSNQHVFVTASRFRRKDQIAPLLEAVRHYEKRFNSNCKLIILGNFVTPKPVSPEKALEQWGIKEVPSSVSFLGPIPNNELPEYYRSADIFLFSHQNPPCPNNVIEAMATGLPVAGVADGSMPELTEHGVNSQLLPTDDGGFLKFRKLDASAFAENMNKIVQQKEKYSTASRQRAMSYYTLDQMISRYEGVLKSIL